MRAASFVEILIEHIRDEVREEVMQEFASGPRATSESSSPSEEARGRAHQAAQTELWLTLHLQPRSSPRGAYGAQTKVRASAPHQAAKAPKQIQAAIQNISKTERQGFAQTVTQILALEFFRHEGAVLEIAFTESDFKKAFRQLALRLHPDRHIEASKEDRESFQHRFSRLTESADELAATLK